MLTALFVGLGSIGTRHLKNLRTLAGQPLTVHALRSDLSRPLRPGVEELLDEQFSDPRKALPHYNLIFVTNPTSLHAETLKHFKGRADCLFIEKPIFSEDQTGLSLNDFLIPGQKAYVAAPMRWSAVMLAVREWLEKNPKLQPYSARVICSSYLPDWRPGVDYRTVYSAHRNMGGGVSIDLIHEWDYLVSLFGKPLEICNMKGTYSELEIDSDDLSVYLARWPHMLGEVHLDYFGHTYQRRLELFTPAGTLTADFGTAALTLPDGTTQNYKESTDSWYKREMSYFLNYAAYGVGDSINSPSEAMDVLRLTLGKL